MSAGRNIVLVTKRCVLWLILSALFVFAVGQGLLVYQLARNGEVVIPGWVAEAVLDSGGIEIDGQRIRFGDLRFAAGGTVTVSRLALEMDGLRLPLIEFAEVSGRLRHSAWQRPSLDLTLDQGRLTDGEHTVVRQLDMAIQIRDGFVREVFASGAHRLSSLAVSGHFEPTPIRRERISIADTLAVVYEGVRAFENATVYLISAENGHLNLRVDNSVVPAELPRIQLDFQADQVRGLYGSLVKPRIELANTVARDWRSGEAEVWTFGGKIDEVRLPLLGIRASALDLSGSFRDEAEPVWDARLQIATLYHGLQTLYENSLSLSNDHPDGQVFARLRTRLSKESLIEVETEIDLAFDGAEARVRGTVDPKIALEHPLIAPFLEHERVPDIRFSEPVKILGKATMDAAFQLEAADLYFRTTHVSIDHIDVDYIEGRAETDGNRIALADLHLERDDLYGEAGATFAIDTGEYYIELKGRVDPVEVGFLVGPWWETIFDPFDFTRQGDSWADFIIRGRANRNRPDYFFGEVRAERVSYYGMPIERGHLRVRGSPWFVELYDFEAVAEDGGDLSGYLAWEIEPQSGTGPRTHWIQLQGAIEPQALAALLTEAGISEASRWAGSFDLDRHAQVSFNGRFHNPKLLLPGDHNSFELDVAIDQPLSFKGIPMDELSFQFNYTEERQALRYGKMRIAEGDASLMFDRFVSDPQLVWDEPIAPEGESGWIRFRVEVEDALRGKATRILEDYLKAQRGEVASELAGDVEPIPASEAADSGGRLDLTLFAEGLEAEVNEMSGSGRFELRDPALASVPVLGPIARILDGTPFGFTNLRLEKMETDFELDRGKLFFPEMKVTGPVATVDAKGYYYLENRQLDFQIQLKPVGKIVGTPQPLRRLGEILIPLPGLLEGDVVGTLDNPRWRSAYDPRSWLLPD